MHALGVLYVVVCVSGLVGNSIVVAVYARKPVKRSSHVFILGLGVIDLFVCSVIMPYGIIAVLYPVILTTELCKMFSWLWHIGVASSAMITAVIAVDRYLSVCRPFFCQITPFHARIIIIVVIIIGSAVSSPVVLYFGVDNASINGTDVITKECKPIDQNRYEGVNIATFVFFANVILIAGVAYVNVSIALCRRARQNTVNVSTISRKADAQREIKQQRRFVVGSGDTSEEILDWRGRVSPIARYTHPNNAHCNLRGNHIGDIELHEKPETSSQNSCFGCCHRSNRINSIDVCHQRNTSVPHEVETKFISKRNKTAHMLMMVTLIFVLTWFPYWTFLFLPATFWTGLPQKERDIYTFLKYLYVINNAVNPLVYGFMNSSFRRDSVALVKRILCHE
ncbi:tyramine receptor Ser-2-like [Saccoglossus kowalevskii]|uniref:Cholecystokinin receptor type A-like n=1 Tax=Saccoglossus kowalevskii TaxID=10224 RepID=A0ABM0MNT8_SACKO|nr:PREDICTED: cholecystokinin receptor type A-like [Saccoglossus kowalevskii]